MYYYLKKLNLETLARTMGVPGLNRKDVYNLNISLPDLNIQKKAINRIEIMEKDIINQENFLKDSSELKKQILKKYLE